MKRENHQSVVFAMLLVGAVFFLSGCATTGMERSVSTSNSIQVVDNDIRRMNVLIDATATSLDYLVKTTEPDLKRSFESYSDNVVKLDVQGQVVITHTAEMTARSTEYFAEWKKQGDEYTNPQIRALSEDRRAKLAEIYARVPAASAGVQNAYLAYQVDLNEIQKYLSNDLTPNGITAITPIVQKTLWDLDVLMASLKPVLFALDEIKIELYGGTE